jgi:ribosomal-protein-alanine N-acetyltransferase
MPESELASVILETERLRLRPMVPGDAASLHSCYGDPQAMQYWDFAVSRDLAHTTARLTDSLATDPRWHRGWGVIHKVSEDFVGYVNYHNRDPWHRRLAVGYILARPYWGQGLMTEACSCSSPTASKLSKHIVSRRRSNPATPARSP